MSLQRHIDKLYRDSPSTRDLIDRCSRDNPPKVAKKPLDTNGYSPLWEQINAISAQSADPDPKDTNFDQSITGYEVASTLTDELKKVSDEVWDRIGKRYAKMLQEKPERFLRPSHEMYQGYSWGEWSSSELPADRLHVEWSPKAPTYPERPYKPQYICRCCGWFGGYDHTNWDICHHCGEPHRKDEDCTCKEWENVGFKYGSDPACPKCRIEPLHCVTNPYDNRNGIRQTISKADFTDMELNSGIAAAPIFYRFMRAYHKKLEREERKVREAAEFKAQLEAMLEEATW